MNYNEGKNNTKSNKDIYIRTKVLMSRREKFFEGEKNDHCDKRSRNFNITSSYFRKDIRTLSLMHRNNSSYSELTNKILSPENSLCNFTLSTPNHIPHHPTSHKRILFLDLDETLVHSSFSPLPSYDVKLHITYKDRVYPVYVNIRPHVGSFLSKMSSLYHIYIFTASIAEYADKVIDYIDKDGVVEKRFYREHCTYHKGIYVKDIRKYIDSHVDISDVVIVDNNPVSFLFNPSSGVAIKTWHSDKGDTELLKVGAMLEKGSVVSRNR